MSRTRVNRIVYSNTMITCSGGGGGGFFVTFFNDFVSHDVSLVLT